MQEPVFQRHIFLNYPAARLPDDLRTGLALDRPVKVTIESSMELVPGMTAVERTFEYRDGAIVKIDERTYVAT
jgi:hypothetical protein